MKLAHQININVIKFQVCGVCTTFINQFRQKKKTVIAVESKFRAFFFKQTQFLYSNLKTYH